MLLDKKHLQSEILEETVKRVKTCLNDEIDEISVERAVIGIFFSGVVLNVGHAGISATPIKEIPEAVCCPSSARSMPNAGHLTERPVSKYLKDVVSPLPMKKAIGMAVLSALSSYCWKKEAAGNYNMQVGVDAIDTINLTDNCYPVVIGAIAPFLRVLKGRKKPFSVIEQMNYHFMPRQVKLRK